MNTMRDDLGLLWIVVQCEPRREPLANFNLIAAGVTIFWVHYSTMAWASHGHKGKRESVLRSYFPGFLFAAIDSPKDIGPIVRARGVQRLLWDIEDQHYIPPRWLAEMRARCLDPITGLHEPPASGPAERGRFAVGQRVRVRGAWELFISTVLNDSGKSIEVSHGEMFGKIVTKIYDPVQLEPL